MNKTLSILSVATTLFIVSCDKESSGTINDFSNSLPAYVDLTGASDTVDAAPGESVEIEFTVRTAIQQQVTITYSVSAPVGLTDQTVVIDRNLLTTTGTFTIPDDAAPTGTVYATLTVTKAETADGQPLTLGRYNDAASQKIVYAIAAP